MHCICLALIVIYTVCNHIILDNHFNTVAGSVIGILAVAVLALALALCTRWVFKVNKVNIIRLNAHTYMLIQ